MMSLQGKQDHMTKKSKGLKPMHKTETTQRGDSYTNATADEFGQERAVYDVTCKTCGADVVQQVSADEAGVYATLHMLGVPA